MAASTACTAKTEPPPPTTPPASMPTVEDLKAVFPEIPGWTRGAIRERKRPSLHPE
jgi:hypothetical protein